MKKLYILVLLYLSAHVLSAQQSDLSNMYPLNYYLINAADAGKDSTWQISTGYRKQWTGIVNSPSSGYLGASGRIGKNHGAGLFLDQSKYGLLSELHAKLSYAYHFRLSTTNTLHAGVSMGLMNRTFQKSTVIASDYTDDLLQQNTLLGTTMESDLGIMFTSQRLLLGASLPQVVHSNAGSSESKTSFPGYYILHGSYDVIQSETWLLQGIVAFRKNGLLKSQTDIGSRILWKNQFGGGVGYRTLGGMFVRAEINIQNLLCFAYSYEQGTSATGRSHELMVSVRFRKRKKNPSTPAEEVSEPVAATRVSRVLVAVDTIIAKPEVTEPAVIDRKVVEETKTINLDSVNEIFAAERLIFFKLKSSDNILSKNYETTIALVVRMLKENPELQVAIVGHTCKLGGEEVNQKISEDRALQVLNELKRNGIAPERMTYSGKGESEPIDRGDAPKHLSKNRRVQIRFSLMTN
jgi:type IX secretion system PorP/SprF family membrane protein